MALPNPRIGNFDYPNHFAHWSWIEPFEIAQPGVAPYIQDGVRDLGFLITPRRSGRPGVVQTETHSTTQAGAWNAILAYRALVGSLVNVTDEWGATWRGVMVMPFGHRIVPVLTPAQNYSATIDWVLWPADPVPG